MKKVYIIGCLMLLSLTVLGQKRETQVLLVSNADSTRAVSFSLKAMAVIDAKCLGCHNPNARNEKSRNALQWEQLQSMEATDAYATLDEISEVLEEGSMPPQKIVAKYPNMKMSDEEAATLRAWVESTLAKLEE